MKKLILFFMLPIMGISQELPHANKVVFEYAKSKIGKKVGEGTCSHLVDSALSILNPAWDEKMKRKYFRSKAKRYEPVYGKRVSSKNVLPGDVFVTLHHVQIVASVKKDGYIECISGNVRKKIREGNRMRDATLKESTCEYVKYSFVSRFLKSKENKVWFYRPQVCKNK